MVRRLQIGTLIGLLASIPACSMRSQSCPRVAGEPAPAPKAEITDAQTLPRQLTIEVQKDGTVHIDGEATSLDNLPRDFVRLNGDAGFVDTTLWVEVGAAPKLVSTVFDLLVRSGAPHIRYALRPPLEAPAAPAQAEDQTPKPAEATDQSAQVANEIGLSADILNEHERAAIVQVELKSIGLHLGGAPKDEMTRKSVLGIIERRFDDFRSCYPLTKELKRSASFGVDLYLGVDGGKVAVKGVRTNLGPDGFRQCMLDAFEKLDFPPLAKKPVMISYALGFSPKQTTK